MYFELITSWVPILQNLSGFKIMSNLEVIMKQNCFQPLDYLVITGISEPIQT